MNSLKKILVIVTGTILFTACGEACGEKKEEVAPLVSNNVKSNSIAFVDIDSLQEKYQFCIDQKEILEAKQKSFQNNIVQKEQSLQQLQANIQKRMQGGQITTEAQYNSEMANFQKQQNAYQKYTLSAQQEMGEEQEKFAKTLQDSINNFLAVYNKSKKYSMIVYKNATLYADKSLDITNEVIVGLNKRYMKK